MDDSNKQSKAVSPLQRLYLIFGIMAVAVGLLGSSFGSGWSAGAFEFFAGIEIMNLIGSFAPYFPFIPFYPIFIIIFGAYLIVKSRG